MTQPTANQQYNSGVAAVQAGDLETATQAFRAALSEDPSFTEARYKLSWTLASQGYLDLAIPQLRVVIDQDPSHLEAHYNLGALLLQKAQLEAPIEGNLEPSILEEAKQAFEKVLSLSPYDQKAFSLLNLIRSALQGCQNSSESST